MLGMVRDTILRTKPDITVFLGDQHHNHSIVHVEVMAFWREHFKTLSGPVIALVGNHDKGPGSDAHAMSAYDGLVNATGHKLKIVSSPTMIDGVLFLPYMERAAFVEACNAHPVPVAVAHQSFDGSKYESGFFAEDGVNLDDCHSQRLFVSGHIHSHQAIQGTRSKVLYPGSPRWCNLNDANVHKHLVLADIDIHNGRVFSWDELSVAECCTPIAFLTETPDSIVSVDVSKVNATIELKGPAQWISSRIPYWKGKAKIRTVPTDTHRIVVRESSGIGTAISDFIDNYTPKSHLVDVHELRKTAKERLL